MEKRGGRGRAGEVTRRGGDEGRVGEKLGPGREEESVGLGAAGEVREKKRRGCALVPLPRGRRNTMPASLANTYCLNCRIILVLGLPVFTVLSFIDMSTSLFFVQNLLLACETPTNSCFCKGQ
jgi:hypothetical protein